MCYFLTTLLYFDPGLGAMLIQGIVAVAAAAALFSKNILFKIKSFLGLIKNEDNDDYSSIEVKEDLTGDGKK